MSDTRFRLAGGLMVAALVLLVGGTSLRSEFLNYDDPQMIVDNPRLRDPGLGDVVAVFTETREFAYLPLSTLALMPDAAFFGRDPAGFHLGSLLWHMIASVLVLGFVHALARSRTVALAAAAIFAVHPMAAESVAWASGRKDQVSLVLLMLALAAALGHLRRGGASRILLASLCAALALLAKGSAIVYPLLTGLLILFVRADGSLAPRARPLALLVSAFVIAGAGAALHLWVALGEGTAALSGFETPWHRVLVFFEALQAYFRHLLVPRALSIHYDVSGEDPSCVIFGAALPVLCIGSIVVLWRTRPGTPKGATRLRALAAGWFLIALLPFNGVFPQTSVAMADRYAFVALPAFGIAVGAVLATLGAWPRVIVLVAILAAFVPLSRARYAEFRDSETVFRAAMRVDASDSLVALKLGEALREKPPVTGNRAEAILLMRGAVASARDPIREARARLLLANALLQDARFSDCVTECDRLLDLERAQGPALRRLGFDAGTVRFNRAAALLGSGRRTEAVLALDEILRTDASHRPARLLWAGLEAQEALVALASAADGAARDHERERVNRSIATYENVIADLGHGTSVGGASAVDQEIQACSDLARLLQRAEWRPERLNVALMRAEALIRRHPDRAEGYLVRAQILSDVDAAAALGDLRSAADHNPRSIVVLRAIASGFLALGKNREAIGILETARARDPGDPGPTADLRGIYLAAAHSHLEGREAGPDLKRAREALKLAQGLGTDHPDVLDLEASLLEAEGHQDEAGPIWERLHALDPANPKAKSGLARYQQRRGLGILAHLKALTETCPTDRRKARREELIATVTDDFKAAIANASGSDEVEFARAWLRTQMRQNTIDPILAGARIAAEKGDLEGAARLLDQAEGLDPLYVEAAELQGHVAMQRGDDGRAFAAFERTLKLDADNLAANDALARLHLRRGETKKALQCARKFLGLAAKMRDETMTLHEEVELMQRLVKTLEEPASESRTAESRR